MTAISECFTPAEQQILDRHFTNIDRNVFCLVGMEEVVKAALFARYSRTHKSLRRLYLDEFADLQAVAGSAGTDDEATEKAAALFDRVFFGFGDDSVAQLGGAHISFEGVSNIATKAIEWGRLGAYLEQSTRYIPYDEKVDGRYKYHTPAELDADPAARTRFEAAADHLFDTYSRMIETMTGHYHATLDRPADVSEAAWGRTIAAKALDAARGLLPAATISNVGMFASGQAYENTLMNMFASDSAEIRDLAGQALAELRRVIPSFLTRVDRADRGGETIAHKQATSQAVAGIADRLGLTAGFGKETSVRLTGFDADAERRLAAALLYPHAVVSRTEVDATVAGLDEDQISEIIAAGVGERANRRHKPGRGFEEVDYRFDIVCDYGAFRDLQRHRMATIEWQQLSVRHGYDIPEDVTAAGAGDIWVSAMDAAAAAYLSLEASHGPTVASYIVPFGYRMRFGLKANARAVLWLTELRSQPQGHPSYRLVAQQMISQIRDVAGHHRIAAAASHIDWSGGETGRSAAEQANQPD